jgi:hypothetical protein
MCFGTEQIDACKRDDAVTVATTNCKKMQDGRQKQDPSKRACRAQQASQNQAVTCWCFRGIIIIVPKDETSCSAVSGNDSSQIRDRRRGNGERGRLLHGHNIGRGCLPGLSDAGSLPALRPGRVGGVQRRPEGPIRGAMDARCGGEEGRCCCCLASSSKSCVAKLMLMTFPITPGKRASVEFSAAIHPTRRVLPDMPAGRRNE